MTPATPPNSRHKKASQPESLLETPQRKVESDGSMGLVTPGTIRVKERLIAPTRPTMMSSPSAALKSPEHTPLNLVSKRGIEFENESLKPISRVLFASELEKGDLRDKKLLPPKRTTGLSFYEDDELFSPKKHAKQVPGTPSDRVVTFELASKWHNESGNNHHSAEDSGGEDKERAGSIVKESSIGNPFLSTTVADKETRELRKKKMLEEEPDITDTVTYVNKSGKVVSKRHISPEEQERFKPVRLFSRELDKEMDKGSE